MAQPGDGSPRHACELHINFAIDTATNFAFLKLVPVRGATPSDEFAHAMDRGNYINPERSVVRPRHLQGVRVPRPGKGRPGWVPHPDTAPALSAAAGQLSVRTHAGERVRRPCLL